MTHFVYVLQRILTAYTGCTNNLRKRFKQHQAGQGSTLERLPVNLIYYEMCLNQQDAYARENI